MIVGYGLILCSCMSFFMVTGSSDAPEQKTMSLQEHLQCKYMLTQLHTKSLMTCDTVYETLSKDMPAHAKSIGERLAQRCIRFTHVLHAHKMRTDAYFKLYKKGTQNSTANSFLESFLVRKLSSEDRELLEKDDNLQESKKICRCILKAMRTYNALQTPEELAQAHMSYVYTIAKSWGRNFLTDPDFQSGNLLNEHGRLNHSTKTLQAWLNDVRKYHLPTRLKKQRKAD